MNLELNTNYKYNIMFLFGLTSQKQRYEGASTIYGPYTLDAYLQEFSQVSEALAKVT